MTKRTSTYEFLKKCALRRESIREGCKKWGKNPATVRKFLYLQRKKRGRYFFRIVKRGRNVGFRYDGVIVFWDRVEEEV